VTNERFKVGLRLEYLRLNYKPGVYTIEQLLLLILDV